MLNADADNVTLILFCKPHGQIELYIVVVQETVQQCYSNIYMEKVISRHQRHLVTERNIRLTNAPPVLAYHLACSGLPLQACTLVHIRGKWHMPFLCPSLSFCISVHMQCARNVVAPPFFLIKIHLPSPLDHDSNNIWAVFQVISTTNLVHLCHWNTMYLASLVLLDA